MSGSWPTFLVLSALHPLLFPAAVAGPFKIPGDGCLRPPPELEQPQNAMTRAKRQLRINSTDPALMSMTNLPYFSEILDPTDPCYKYICYPMPRASPFYAWVKRFNQDRCCRFEDQHISIGDFRTLDGGADFEDGIYDSDKMFVPTCSQKIVRCKLPEFPHDPPETVVEVLPNARCCVHEGRMIPPGEMVLDAERCAVIGCHEATAGIDFPGNKDLQITKVFEHSCGCCIFEGRMVKDGDWLVSNGEPLNITCIKGKLFHIKEMDGERKGEDLDGDDEDDETETSGGLLELDLPKKDPLTPADGTRCNNECDPYKALEPFFAQVRSLMEELKVDNLGLVLEQHNMYLNLVAQALLAAISPGPAASSSELKTFVSYYSHFCTLREDDDLASKGFGNKMGRYEVGMRSFAEAGKSGKNGTSCYFGYSVDDLQGHPADCKLFNSWIKLLLMQDEPHEMPEWRIGTIRMGLSNLDSNMKGVGHGLVVVFTDVPEVANLDQLLLHLPADQIQKMTEESGHTVAVVNVNDNKLLMSILQGAGNQANAVTSIVSIGDKSDIDDFYNCNLKCKCSQEKQDVFQNQMKTFRAYRGSVRVHRNHGRKGEKADMVFEDVSVSFRTAVFKGGVCPANLDRFSGMQRRRKAFDLVDSKYAKYPEVAVGPVREVGDILVLPHLQKDDVQSGPSKGFNGFSGRSYNPNNQRKGQPQKVVLMSMADRDAMTSSQSSGLFQRAIHDGTNGYDDGFSASSLAPSESYNGFHEDRSNRGFPMMGRDIRPQRDSDLGPEGGDSPPEVYEAPTLEAGGEVPQEDEHPYHLYEEQTGTEPEEASESSTAHEVGVDDA